jgi:hypothetical protein
VLATLVDAYEAEHYPKDPPDPVEAIKFRMEQQGLTRRDLEEIIGTRTPHRRGSESKARTVDRDDPPLARAPRHLGRCADPSEPKECGVNVALIRESSAWAVEAIKPCRPIMREIGGIRRH